jgi:peptidoglycan/xylan/chitin deacetylase (PgdA/CDA1 family)
MKALLRTTSIILMLGSVGCGQQYLTTIEPSTYANVTNDLAAPDNNSDSLPGSSAGPDASASANTASPLSTPIPTPIPSLPAKDIHFKEKVIVFMYHHIAESEAGEEVTITPAKFESHLKILKENKYQVISIEDYVHFLKEGKAVPPNAVVITFDDGYESYYRYAYHLLKKYGYTATNFVVTSYLDSNNPSLPFMKWDHLKQMKTDGFSFYSHSHNLHAKVKGADNQLVAPLAHPIWLEAKKRLENEDEYRKRIRDDLGVANQMLHENLGNQMNILCFPYGYYNKTVTEIGNQIGIDFFFTTQDGINSKRNKEIVRIHAGTRYMTAERLLAKLNKFKDNPSH